MGATEKQIPESRVYRHRRCGAETEVDDGPFSALSDPLAGMHSTWCDECEDDFSLKEFEWADTGELIPKYYIRHSKNASGLDRFLGSRNFLFLMAGIGLVLGIVVGLFCFPGQGIWCPIVLGMIGPVLLVCVNEMFIGKMVTKKVFGVKDTRMLR